jgi:hypothetical protein
MSSWIGKNNSVQILDVSRSLLNGVHRKCQAVNVSESRASIFIIYSGQEMIFFLL